MYKKFLKMIDKKYKLAPKTVKLHLQTPNECVIIVKHSKCGVRLKFYIQTEKSFECTRDFLNFCSKKQNARLSCYKNKRVLRREGCDNVMANVRDTANHLVRLYYYGNKNCTSAAIQKVLIIAQLRSIYANGEPLFDDDLIVKPSCFSIKLISNTYPDIIFNEDNRIPLVDSYSLTDYSTIPNVDNSLPNLSSFYDFFGVLTQQEIDTINETYKRFGKFSGRCIGEYMKMLTLHQNSTVFSSITTNDLRHYLDNIPEEDRSNPIIMYVCS